MLLREGADSLGVRPGRPVEERAEGAAVGEPGLERGRVVRDQHLGEVGVRLDDRDRPAERDGVARVVRDRDPVQQEILADPGQFEVADLVDHARDRGLVPEVRDPEEDARLVVEGLLVPVEDELVSDPERALADADLHEPDRGTGRGAEHGLRILVEVRAELDVGLARRESHGERQAGRDAALLAVLLRQEAVDVEGLERHQADPRSPRSRP